MSSRDPIALGIDVGTTNTKVAAVAGVRVIAAQSSPTPANAQDLAGVVARLVGEAAAACPRRPKVIGIASMAETGIALGAGDRPLTGLLRWQDAPGSSTAADALADRLGRDALFAATGVRAAAKVPLVVWAALASGEVGTFKRMRRWAGVADYIHLTLTGRLRTDHTLAGRTMAYRLPGPGEPLPSDFDLALLSEVGLTPDQLPRVGLPGEELDGLEDPESSIGLPAGTPVLVAGHDHQVGAWASGVRVPGDVADSIGTAEAVLTLVGETEVRRPLAGEGFSLVRAIDGATEGVLGGSPAAGAFLQWCADRWTRGSIERLLAGTDGVPKKVLAGAEFLLPYPAGRQCPAPDAAASVRRIAGTKSTDLDGSGHVPHGVAAIEAVSYQAQWIIDRQRELTRLPDDVLGRLCVLGEPVRANALWQALKPTLAGRTATLVTEPYAVAAGAAMLALSRVGELSADAALDCTRLHPMDDLIGPYRERLAGFKTVASWR